MSALLSQLLLAAASNAGAPTAAPSVCVEAAAAAAIDIAASTVTHSNLGGFGPDSGDETLVFSNAGTTPDGTDFDISIAADSGYAVNNANANGIGNKVFGKINILTNSSGVSSAFTFSLVDSATQQPVVLDEFAFSVYDFDMGASNNAEFAIASGYDYYKLESTTEIAVEAEADGRTRFSFDTDFKYRRFGAASAAPRNASALTGLKRTLAGPPAWSSSKAGAFGGDREELVRGSSV